MHDVFRLLCSCMFYTYTDLLVVRGQGLPPNHSVVSYYELIMLRCRSPAHKWKQMNPTKQRRIYHYYLSFSLDSVNWNLKQQWKCHQWEMIQALISRHNTCPDPGVLPALRMINEMWRTWAQEKNRAMSALRCDVPKMSEDPCSLTFWDRGGMERSENNGREWDNWRHGANFLCRKTRSRGHSAIWNDSREDFSLCAIHYHSF